MDRENPYGVIQELEQDCTRMERELGDLQSENDGLRGDLEDAQTTIEDLVQGGQGRTSRETVHAAYIIGTAVVMFCVGLGLGGCLWN